MNKGVPLAAVVYVVRFDGKGRALKEAGFHIEQSGQVHLDGSAAASLEALLAASRCCMKETVGLSMREVFNEHVAEELTGPGAWEEAAALEPLPLPAAGEIF